LNRVTLGCAILHLSIIRSETNSSRERIDISFVPIDIDLFKPMLNFDACEYLIE